MVDGLQVNSSSSMWVYASVYVCNYVSMYGCFLAYLCYV